MLHVMVGAPRKGGPWVHTWWVTTHMATEFFPMLPLAAKGIGSVILTLGSASFGSEGLWDRRVVPDAYG